MHLFVSAKELLLEPICVESRKRYYNSITDILPRRRYALQHLWTADWKTADIDQSIIDELPAILQAQMHCLPVGFCMQNEDANEAAASILAIRTQSSTGLW